MLVYRYCKLKFAVFYFFTVNGLKIAVFDLGMMIALSNGIERDYHIQLS